MSCDRCGLDDDCYCYVEEIEKRVSTLEEQLLELTNLTTEMGRELKRYIDNIKDITCT